jgi:two-component system chemotaxis sensor kinase CheA
MNPLLAQFLSESAEFLEAIAAKLMQLEKAPGDAELMTQLFRLVHTLKGNSGLFEFPEMTKVLHAAEDLMDAVRTGTVTQSPDFTDQILDAMDFVGTLTREIEADGVYGAQHREASVRIAAGLRALMGETSAQPAPGPTAKQEEQSVHAAPAAFANVPEELKRALLARLQDGEQGFWLVYKPEEGCFFQGDDPFFLARHTPGQVWGRAVPREAWPELATLDPYRCILDFEVVAVAFKEELMEHFRYVPDQVEILEIAPAWFGSTAAAPAQDGVTLPVEVLETLTQILRAQSVILSLEEEVAEKRKRIPAVRGVIVNCLKSLGQVVAVQEFEALCASASESGEVAGLLGWIQKCPTVAARSSEAAELPALVEQPGLEPADTTVAVARPEEAAASAGAAGGSGAAKSLKVDQLKIDRLMNLIGELVVSKNAIPYLAQRAETQFGVRELSREIKGQYSVINRIAEEMQDAIMQIRMMPVSVIFQRFPRLVRDISRKLGKEVALVLEGEDTEADKNIIEALADPLIHIVRNSLDHGLETPEVRKAAGKSATGTLTIRATQEGDRVLIEIRDDGKGINPEIIKRKAYEKGVIDEATFENISDQDAIHLIFAAGFSTAEVVSDLSGRGVGMDVVRSAVEKINGSIELQSEVGKGTRLAISLPLSMAVTQVMIVESDRQIFGVPMDHVVETVRVPRTSVKAIKQAQTTLLRGRVIPLKTLNGLLRIPAQPLVSADDEYAVLVVRVGTDVLGVIVDQFRETVDVIQKPMSGILSGLQAYSGSALMGDGSVLMILNLREMI